MALLRALTSWQSSSSTLASGGCDSAMPVYHTGYSPSPPTQSLKAWAPRPPLEGSRPGSARKPAAAGLEKPGPRGPVRLGVTSLLGEPGSPTGRHAGREGLQVARLGIVPP